MYWDRNISVSVIPSDEWAGSRYRFVFGDKYDRDRSFPFSYTIPKVRTQMYHLILWLYNKGLDACLDLKIDDKKRIVGYRIPADDRETVMCEIAKNVMRLIRITEPDDNWCVRYFVSENHTNDIVVVYRADIPYSVGIWWLKPYNVPVSVLVPGNPISVDSRKRLYTRTDKYPEGICWALIHHPTSVGVLSRLKQGSRVSVDVTSYMQFVKSVRDVDRAGEFLELLHHAEIW